MSYDSNNTLKYTFTSNFFLIGIAELATVAPDFVVELVLISWWMFLRRSKYHCDNFLVQLRIVFSFSKKYFHDFIDSLCSRNIQLDWD